MNLEDRRWDLEVANERLRDACRGVSAECSNACNSWGQRLSDVHAAEAERDSAEWETAAAVGMLAFGAGVIAGMFISKKS